MTHAPKESNKILFRVDGDMFMRSAESELYQDFPVAGALAEANGMFFAFINNEVNKKWRQEVCSDGLNRQKDIFSVNFGSWKRR